MEKDWPAHSALQWWLLRTSGIIPGASTAIVLPTERRGVLRHWAHLFARAGTRAARVNLNHNAESGCGWTRVWGSQGPLSSSTPTRDLACQIRGCICARSVGKTSASCGAAATADISQSGFLLLCWRACSETSHSTLKIASRAWECFSFLISHVWAWRYSKLSSPGRLYDDTIQPSRLRGRCIQAPQLSR